MNEYSEKLKNIKSLVGNGYLEKALLELRKVTHENYFSNEAIIQSARYKAVLEHERYGIATKRIELNEKARIAKSVLEIVDLLSEEENIFNEETTQVQESIEGKQEIGTITHSGHGDIVAGNKIIGDTTSNAKARYDVSISIIKDEIIRNLQTLSNLISHISSTPPRAFMEIEKRKLNETDNYYQEKAKLHHLQYRDFIFRVLQEFKLIKENFHAHQINLAIDINTSSNVNEIYIGIQETFEILDLYFKGIDGLIQVFNNDLSYTETLKSNFSERIIFSKIYFTHSILSGLKLFSIEQNINLFQELLANAKISLISTEKSFKENLLKTLDQLFEERKKTIETQEIAVRENSNPRKIQKEINDPYIVTLRKRLGLTNFLSEAEQWSLENRDTEIEEDNPQKLIVEAIFSYLESDGSLTLSYFEKAFNYPNLPEREKKFLEISIRRLKDVDLFEGSLGIIILSIWDKGSFFDAGLKLGDVIYMINNELISDPIEITGHLGRISETGKLLIQYYDSRKGTHSTTIIKGGKSAGAVISQLVIWTPMQI